MPQLRSKKDEDSSKATIGEVVRNAAPRPRQPRPVSRREELRSFRLAKETNEIMRDTLEDRRRHQFTSVKRFIGPLPRPVGLLDESVREGRRVWALPSPFLHLLYGQILSLPSMSRITSSNILSGHRSTEKVRK